MTPYYITKESVETMTDWEQFEQQMRDADVLVTRLYGSKSKLAKRVVVRTDQGDFEIAAVHKSEDGDTLILDMGQPFRL